MRRDLRRQHQDKCRGFGPFYRELRASYIDGANFRIAVAWQRRSIDTPGKRIPCVMSKFACPLGAESSRKMRQCSGGANESPHCFSP